jgi:predicted dehydrogenase
VTLHGTNGTLHYDFDTDRIRGSSKRRGGSPGGMETLQEIPIPGEKAGSWRVEADWVDSIREGKPVRLTDFTTGVAYMEFTEAVAQSAQTGVQVELPLSSGEEASDKKEGAAHFHQQ